MFKVKDRERHFPKSRIHLMYSPSPPQLPQLLCCGCALCTRLGGPGGPVHDVHGHVAFSHVVHGTGYNETPCATK
jgi:hypothetical protein